MQCMVGSLASVVGGLHSRTDLLCLMCSAFHCLGQHPYKLIINILLRCFPLIIMLDWQCTVDLLAPIIERYIQKPICSVSFLRCFTPFCVLLVMHAILCHVALHSGTHQLFFLCVFGTDSQQLNIQAILNAIRGFSTMQTFWLHSKLLVDLKIVAVVSHF